MTALHKSECPGGAGQSAEKHSNDLNFATDTRKSKTESNLRAMYAIAGHTVHTLKDGGYLVSKYGYTHHAIDLNGLQAFAVRVGICHE